MTIETAFWNLFIMFSAISLLVILLLGILIWWANRLYYDLTSLLNERLAHHNLEITSMLNDLATMIGEKLEEK